MKVEELINNGIKKLNQNQVLEANIKARILLQHILGLSRSDIIAYSAKEVEKQVENLYESYLQELIQGKPIQYITNLQEFMGLNFYVDENVLIPQPDTEVLVEEAIKEIVGIQKEKIRILELCTGSGAIAISIAKYLQEKSLQYEIYGTDISQRALEIAEKNAKHYGIKITFILSDMFQKIESKKLGTFDIVIANPPYIETNTIKTLSEEVKREPFIALDGGKDGLHFYRILAKEGKKYLKEDGMMLLEIGYNQKSSVIKILEKEKCYNNVSCIKDLSGNDRVIKALKTKVEG